jgi:hypothetical protein
VVLHNSVFSWYDPSIAVSAEESVTSQSNDTIRCKIPVNVSKDKILKDKIYDVDVPTMCTQVRRCSFRLILRENGGWAKFEQTTQI